LEMLLEATQRSSFMGTGSNPGKRRKNRAKCHVA